MLGKAVPDWPSAYAHHSAMYITMTPIVMVQPQPGEGSLSALQNRILQCLPTSVVFKEPLH